MSFRPYIQGSLSRSTLPPVMITPTRLPRNTSGLRRIAARRTAQDGSITIFIRANVRRMASIISCSEVRRISVTWVFTKCHVKSFSGTFSPSAHQPFSHGDRRVIGDDTTGFETAISVVGLFWFGCINFYAGCNGRQRQTRARDHPAPPRWAQLPHTAPAPVRSSYANRWLVRQSRADRCRDARNLRRCPQPLGQKPPRGWLSRAHIPPRGHHSLRRRLSWPAGQCAASSRCKVSPAALPLTPRMASPAGNMNPF